MGEDCPGSHEQRSRLSDAGRISLAPDFPTSPPMSTESEHQVLGERYELERIVREDALGRTWRAIDLKGTAKVDVRMIPEWVDHTEARAFLDAVAGELGDALPAIMVALAALAAAAGRVRVAQPLIETLLEPASASVSR